MKDLTIKKLIEESHQTAKDKGWYDPPKTFIEALALFHSEISEALEEYRDNHQPTEIYWKISPSCGELACRVLTNEAFQKLPPRIRHHLLDKGHAKPEGIPIELADLFVRVADTCGYYDIDLEQALRLKMAYNETRPFRHGEKVS